MSVTGPVILVDFSAALDNVDDDDGAAAKSLGRLFAGVAADAVGVVEAVAVDLTAAIGLVRFAAPVAARVEDSCVEWLAADVAAEAVTLDAAVDAAAATASC